MNMKLNEKICDACKKEIKTGDNYLTGWDISRTERHYHYPICIPVEEWHEWDE
jgi:hypothetical protein